MVKLEYRLLVYRSKTRHKLIRRFRNYWKMATWLSDNVSQEDIKFYYYKKQKI